MRGDLKDRLMERLTDALGPMRYCTIIQVADVVDLVEEVVDNDADWRELERLQKLEKKTP
jgi:hypothetical protein